MATLDDVRAIASKLPCAFETPGRFTFSLMVGGKPKGFLWTWAEKIHPRRARVINDAVIAVHVPNELVKQMLISTEPAIYFTEPHYDGFLAVLVRLEAISREDLEHLVIEGWKCKAPAKDVQRFTKSP